MIDYGWTNSDLDPAEAPDLPSVDVTSFYKATLTVGFNATLSQQDTNGADPGGEQTTVTPVANSIYLKGGAEGAKVEAGVRADDFELEDFDLRFGFLDLTATGGTFDLDATVTAAFNDGGDGKISLTELTTPITDAEVSTAGSATIVLPVEVKAIPDFEEFSDTFNQDAGVPIERSITFSANPFADTTQPLGGSDDDPRAALTITYDNFDDLEPFRGIGALDVFSVLRQIEGVFDILETLQPGEGATEGSLEPLFRAELPFLDNTTLSDMIDFGGAWQDMIRQLVHLPGSDTVPGSLTPTTVVEAAFTSVQDLVGKLDVLLDPGDTDPLTVLNIIKPTYDLDDHQLKFRNRLRRRLQQSCDVDELQF